MTAIPAELYVAVRDALNSVPEYRQDYEWAQGDRAPKTAEEFAREFTWVVLNSGIKNTVARKLMDRIWPALFADDSIAHLFGHEGKRAAIERVWRERGAYFRLFQQAQDKVAFCDELPWIGKITKWHLAKNLGVDCAKPDRWLVRLAASSGETVDGLCQRLARESGDRVATVDLVLWRACAIGLLKFENGQPRLGRSAA